MRIYRAQRSSRAVEKLRERNNNPIVASWGLGMVTSGGGERSQEEGDEQIEGWGGGVVWVLSLRGY